MNDTPKTQDPGTPHYKNATGGWGSLYSVMRQFLQDRPTPGALMTLARQNKPAGHMCTSCAWTKPPAPHPAEFCENGAKATLWELTRDRCTPEFFAQHSVTELRGWSDHALEKTGRLTHPMRYDAASDRYVPASWDQAFASIGASLRALDPRSTVFYTSGRASLETSYLWSLFARAYGHNNLPDSSNMCHETTSVALKEVIGVSVGTCVWEDFKTCDVMLFFGQNTGSNSPRLLHPLQQARKRGCKVVVFNPVREKGLLEFVNPQNPAQMVAGPSTAMSDLYLQLNPGGDIAAMGGIAKHLFALEDQRGGVVDRTFIEEHTAEFSGFEAWARALDWAEIEAFSGLSRQDLEAAADICARSERTIALYGMGLTQHVHGSQSIGTLINLLLMRGMIGREGTGICPVRGHSNVQGQRTVGISEKPDLVPLDKLAEQFGFEPPRDEGWTTVSVAEALLDGRMKGFLSLGGNFARAIPDQGRLDPCWQNLALNVQIATKLNRSHVLVGDGAWLLPCLARSEEDRQATGRQTVTVEDSLSHIHGSVGRRTPASPQLLSEPAIVTGLAKATLGTANPKLRWDAWCADYSLIRDEIEKTYPDMFRRFNERMFQAGGFYRGNSARERDWKTENGKAIFTVPDRMTALAEVPGAGVFTLMTLRSNGQFNTTIYDDNDRLRGLKGNRMIVLMSPGDVTRAGLAEGQMVTLVSDHDDGFERRLGGLRIVPYDLPSGCVAAYYPEANPLVPLDLHDKASKTPASKGVPVRVVAD
ncbi:MAG: FdhF/YdeP family oxidoreductase [Pseudotabrizicola sp.]|uniref:FdhF/YdeP family oxidoreductase n=1 Tax=Pseudotabrizicola sp. TaxID=2939647 RepID=UPI0027182D0D|nr:FdhF/YdeP family oxidoreductase [Pseudotabrizicola sp.]MDO9637024.1 FdhF/YdeP family oxidoreductase [Pseudotabrizicola sp.]